MVTVRRWYVFLVCFISLQAVAWAAISLLRDLLTRSGGSVTATAFQIAIIVIGLPVFLAHWLWAQSLARKDADERESALRRFYLYGTLAAFLGPLAANTLELLANLLTLPFGGKHYVDYAYAYSTRSTTDILIGDLVVIAVLGLLWFYHQRVTAADAKAVPETGNAATVRRLYVLGFSAAGVWAATLAVVNLLHWIMLQFGGELVIGNGGAVTWTDEVARLVVGVPLWLLFWRWAQHLFTSPSEEERESALRKLYLYLIVFIASLTAVTNATMILAGLFRRLLGLPLPGDIRGPLALIIGMAVLWAYHAYALRGDAALAGEAPRQAGVRRLYLYLVAAVGLAAFLVGVSGDISVLIRAVGEPVFGEDLLNQLAWFTAALLAGLPVWLWPWRLAQVAAVAAGASGADERRSIVRKIYLYFYLFVATMTVLSSAVYIVYRLLTVVLGAGGNGNLLTDLAQAMAYMLIASGVWLYHGFVLRGDGQANRREQTKRLEAFRVAVVDTGDGHWGRSLLDSLRRELPGLVLAPLGLTEAAAQNMGGTLEDIPAQLATAGLIVGPWSIALAGGAVPAEVAAAVAASAARKLLIPVRAESWEWVGVDRWSAEAIVRQAVRAVKQMVEGQEVKPARPLSAGAIIGILICVLFLLILLAIPVLYFFVFRSF